MKLTAEIVASTYGLAVDEVREDDLGWWWRRIPGGVGYTELGTPAEVRMQVREARSRLDPRLSVLHELTGDNSRPGDIFRRVTEANEREGR